MKRLDYLDLAKGIGILLVVLGHASLKNEYITAYIYSFHMPLFFVIAGMLICATQSYTRRFREVLLGKLRTLMLPYLIFSIIYTMIDLLRHDTYTKTNAVFSACFQGSGPLWFLPTLFITELIFILLIKYCKKAVGITVAFLLGLTGFFISSRFLFVDLDKIMWGQDVNLVSTGLKLVALRSLSCLVFLCVGFVLMTILPRLKSEVFSASFGTALLILNIIPIIIQFQKGTSPRLANMTYMELQPGPVTFVLCSISGSVGLILLCKAVDKLLYRRFTSLIGRPLRFWGRNSLLIMVTHLNCQILFLGNLFAAFMNQFITHAKDYIFLFNVILICMLAETLLIMIVNRFCPWIIGKKGTAKNKDGIS